MVAALIYSSAQVKTLHDTLNFNGRDDHQAAEDALVAALEHQMELLTEADRQAKFR